MNFENVILEVALFVNKELFNDGKISYRMFKYTEDEIIKRINNIVEVGD